MNLQRRLENLEQAIAAREPKIGFVVVQKPSEPDAFDAANELARRGEAVKVVSGIDVENL